MPQDALVRSIVVQEQLGINVPQSSSGGGGGGGLFGLLADLVIKSAIESGNRSRNERAQALVAPLLKSTAEQSLREPLWRELRTATANSPWLRTTSFETTAVAKATTVEELKDRGQLRLETNYWLSENGVVLMVQTRAKYWLRGEAAPAYFGWFTYYSDPVAEVAGEPAIAAWMANGNAALLQAIAAGNRATADMLLLDLLAARTPSPDEKAEEFSHTHQSPVTGSSTTLAGRLQRRDGDRVLLRERGGNLFSFSTRMGAYQRPSSNEGASIGSNDS